MNSPTNTADRVHNPRSGDTAAFNLLAEFALDMRWSWNHAADEIWWQLDPELWNLTHNP